MLLYFPQNQRKATLGKEQNSPDSSISPIQPRCPVMPSTL